LRYFRIVFHRLMSSAAAVASVEVGGADESLANGLDTPEP
jgi:hypothetical protein